MQIKIGNKTLGENSPTFIIAEGGVNHNSSIEVGKKLIDAAITSGADAIKFQNFNTDLLVRKDAPKAKYQDLNIGFAKSQYQMLKELELSESAIIELKNYSEEKGIIFFSTPYDLQGLEFLEKIGILLYKLASMDIVCHPLIRRIAKTGRPLILSTGMATEEEVAAATKVFKSEALSPDNLILLQCNSNYPSRPEDQNLFAMKTLRNYTEIVGYSDHTEGLEISMAATALGAQVIERHLTLDKNMPGPDHSSSMDTQEFKKFVEGVRKIELALGNGEKKPLGGELENIIGMRRSICANSDLLKGTIIKEIDLTYKRPGNGLFPTTENLENLIGKKTIVDIVTDENITFDKVI